jgi:hypothetical protein
MSDLQTRSPSWHTQSSLAIRSLVRLITIEAADATVDMLQSECNVWYVVLAQECSIVPSDDQGDQFKGYTAFFPK